MSLSVTPSRRELEGFFRQRQRPSYDEVVLMESKIHAVLVRGDRLHIVRVNQPARTALTVLQPAGQGVALRPVAEFYTFHNTVGWSHTVFRPTLADIYASMSNQLRNDTRICGVSVHNIYGTTEFGGESWHVGIATAYTRS